MSSALMVGVSGLRGVIGSSLSPDVCTRFAGSFADWLIDHAAGRPVTIILARDGRAGNAFVHHAACAGLLAAGVRVLDLGVAMTPTTAVLVDRHAADHPDHLVAGMVLTASHNPQQWNGLKCLFADGRGLHGSSACAPSAPIAAQVAARFHESRPALAPWSAIGSLSADVASAAVHIARVADALEDHGLAPDSWSVGNDLRIVVDSVNASGIVGARDLAERLGVDELLHLGCEPTGIFPHPPEPVAAHLDSLRDSVRESGAAVGFAQDPDADRLAIVDEKGAYIGEEYTLVLGAIALLESMKQAGKPTKDAALVVNLSTSRMIEDIAARYGARVLRTAVGEANVVETMKRENAILGGEGNGGVIWPAVTYVRDSLSAMAMVMSLLRHTRTPLSSIVAGIPSYAIVKEKVDLARKDDAAPAIDAIARAFAKERVDRQDGVWVGLDAKRAWLHVRASNTEPIMRLIAEAPSENEARALLAHARQVIAEGSPSN